MSTPALRVVDENTVLNTNTGEVQGPADAVAGLLSTIELQAKKLGRLERELSKAQGEDMDSHPQRKEISDLIRRWRKATGHPKAKLSKDRFDLVKARLKDGYSIEQLELAIDGIGAFPYVVNAQRRREGKPSQRHDALSIALKGGEKVEQFCNLGWQARQEAEQE